MVRSAAKPRVSNHGRLAPLSPAARPSRRAAFGRAPQDEVEGYCKPHGEERGEAARLEPWATGTALARGPSFETPPSAAPQDEVEEYDGPHGEERGEAARLEPWPAGTAFPVAHPSRRGPPRSAQADL